MTRIREEEEEKEVRRQTYGYHRNPLVTWVTTHLSTSGRSKAELA